MWRWEGRVWRNSPYTNFTKQHAGMKSILFFMRFRVTVERQGCQRRRKILGVGVRMRMMREDEFWSFVIMLLGLENLVSID
jgi:hypothetical protein